MNHNDLIKLAHRADLDGDVELADYLDNQLIRVAFLKKIIPNLAKGWEHTRRPNYDIDFSSLKPDASNLDTMIKHPTQTGTSPVGKFFQAGLKTVKRTPERLVEIEKEIKNAILNIASSDPKIDVAKKKVQSGQALTADERNSLLNILVRDQKVATRKNDIAVEDITAVLDNKAPSLATKEVTTLSKAGKAMGYAAGAGVLANAGLAAFNTAQQANYKPGELYNDQITAPGMQVMPSGMQDSPAYRGGGGNRGGGNGGGYSGPTHNMPQSKDEVNETKKYKPPYLNDQLYGPQVYSRTLYTDSYNQNDSESFDDGFTQDDTAYNSYEPQVPPSSAIQGSSRYQPIGPTTQEEVNPGGVEYVNVPTETYDLPQAPVEEGSNTPNANFY